MHVNTWSCFLYAFSTCRLSYTIIAVGRSEEHIHVRLHIDMSGWTCTLIVLGHLKENVHVWLDMNMSSLTGERLRKNLIEHVEWYIENVREPCKQRKSLHMLQLIGPTIPIYQIMFVSQNWWIHTACRLVDVWRIYQSLWEMNATNYNKGVNQHPLETQSTHRQQHG